MRRLTGRRPWSLAVVATASLLLMGCGVSGKPDVNASPATSGAPQTTTSVPETTSTTADPSGPETTVTTLPDSSETTEPSLSTPSIPFGTGDIKRALIRAYKQSGFTDKEARCVTNAIVKGSGEGAFDPGQLDLSKLTAAAKRCLGADGVPGGND